MDCGPQVTSLKPGDLVFPAVGALGTWQSLNCVDEDKLIKMNPNISVHQAANMSINSATAYLMLTKFVELKPGDCVIQNGATSAVGIDVMQMGKIMGVTTVSR